ncbi:MAG: glycosyltransferase [Lachnospiraceae bacterium]|nr:glycosyltransferase [Lachnospiraceae bacterium]
MNKRSYEIIPAPKGENLAEYRNTAIKKCRADYMVFEGPDMVFDPAMGDVLASEMERSGAGLVLCGYDITEGDEVIYETPEFNRRVMDREDMLCRYFYQTHYQGYVCNKMFKTSVLKKKRIRFDTDIPGSEEMLFLVRYTKAIHDVVMLPDILCHIKNVGEADLGLELEAFYRMRKKLWRHDDAQWLCDQNIELLEMELDTEI